MSGIKIINFMALRKIAGALSMALVLGALASLAINQLQFGLDFTGGTLIEVGYEQAPNLVNVRVQLQDAGFDDAPSPVHRVPSSQICVGYSSCRSGCARISCCPALAVVRTRGIGRRHVVAHVEMQRCDESPVDCGLPREYSGTAGSTCR